MVTIQPFQYEKTTAFKERVQIANKVNEIINLFNELDIESKINEFNEEIVIINGKIAEIDSKIVEVNNAVNTVEGYDTRLTNVENGTVKLSGNQTIEDIKTYTKSPIVPNPPNGDTSTKAVNTNWVSQTGDSAPNNLIHKTGNESKSGTFICPEVRTRTYYSTKHVVQLQDATSGVYYKIYSTKITSNIDRNAIIMWNNTRKGLPSQIKECGFITIGARVTNVQIANIAGSVPTNHFAITRKVNNDNDVDVIFWATGQIKVFDILFESIGYNNVDTWTIGDLSTESDFSNYDEVVYL